MALRIMLVSHLAPFEIPKMDLAVVGSPANEQLRISSTFEGKAPVHTAGAIAAKIGYAPLAPSSKLILSLAAYRNKLNCII